MEKHHLYLAILLSLLAGVLITVCTSRVDVTRDRSLNADCGYSISSANPDQRTTLRWCVLDSYGWPAQYANSGVRVMLSDYHTVFPYDPANAGSMIGYTSFSRLRFTIDWLLWSIVSFAFITTTCMIVNHTRKDKPAALHPKRTIEHQK